MGEVGILVKPPTLRAARECLENICRLRAQSILFNLPDCIEESLVSLSRGEISYDQFLKVLEEKLPYPSSAWIKEYEPIIKELCNVSRDIDIYCYMDSQTLKEHVETSMDIALLTLKSIVSEKIDIDSWLHILKKMVTREEYLRSFRKILRVCNSYDRVLCVSGFEGKYLKKKLSEEDVYSWVKYLGQPYHFTPLEILKKILLRREVSKDIVEKLVREHIKFIREYVYYMPYIEAVERWVEEKLYWIPPRIRYRDL
ncbi:MAG: hypothetical protein QXK95_00910 [Nitrososphaerota archaeon]